MILLAGAYPENSERGVGGLKTILTRVQPGSIPTTHAHSQGDCIIPLKRWLPSKKNSKNFKKKGGLQPPSYPQYLPMLCQHHTSVSWLANVQCSESTWQCHKKVFAAGKNFSETNIFNSICPWLLVSGLSKKCVDACRLFSSCLSILRTVQNTTYVAVVSVYF